MTTGFQESFNYVFEAVVHYNDGLFIGFVLGALFGVYLAEHMMFGDGE